MTVDPQTIRAAAWVLFGASFTGLAYVLMRALSSGAQAYAGAYSERTARDFEDLFLFVPPRRITEIGWACAIAFFLVVALLFFDPAQPTATLVGLALGSLAGALALMAPNRLLAVLRERRRRRFNIQLVDALAHMSNALKAGFSLNQAFETVVETGLNPIAQEFHVFLQQLRVGMPINDALQSLEQRVGSEDLTLVVTTIDIARRTGGNLTEVFDRIALTIRERMRIESRVRTLTAQGRLQGIVVGAMPLILGVAMTVLRPGMMLPFLKSGTGMIAVAAVVVLITLGGLMIRKIIRIDV
jgi:tight adherence protein B